MVLTWTEHLLFLLATGNNSAGLQPLPSPPSPAGAVVLLLLLVLILLQLVQSLSLLMRLYTNICTIFYTTVRLTELMR